ncbi:MAG: hypothetical protein KatS3mg092_0544 [Patescibacteria group bacterium]|nr:MAG: hypothetical protein KatS3mg092_0544 [Patescibacteria group bacterium]
MIGKKSKIIFLSLFLLNIIFIFYFSYLAIRRVETLNSHYYDLGIMNQVVYNTSRGRILEMTNPTFLKNMSRLAIHFDPILIFFAPFYFIYPSYIWLIIFQVIIISLGSVFLFLLAKKIIKNDFYSFLISVTYLSYFAIERMILFDFHAVVLATTFFIAAFYFLEIKNWRWFYVFVVLSLLTKEHIGLIVLFLGIYIFIVKKEKKHGLITIFLGLIFFLTTTYFIIPYFRGDKHFASNYFSNIKSRLPTIISNGYEYFLRLVNPLFFSLLAPEIFLIAAPEWGINILSLNNNMRAIYFHYHAIIVVFLFIAVIYGFQRFLKIVKSKKIRLIILTIFILLNIYSIYLYNPLTFFGKQKVEFQEIHPLTKQSIKLWQEKLKDENIIVATTPKLAPFFTNRKQYFNFLFDPAFGEIGEIEDDIINRSDKYKKADYVIIYKKEIGDLSKGSLSVKFYQKLLEDKNFQMIYSDNLNDRYGGSVEVYKKIKN